MLTDISTSDETGYSEPVYKHIVNQLAACKEFGYHIEIGSDGSGRRQHGLQGTTCDKIQKCCCLENHQLMLNLAGFHSCPLNTVHMCKNNFNPRMH